MKRSIPGAFHAVSKAQKRADLGLPPENEMSPLFPLVFSLLGLALLALLVLRIRELNRQASLKRHRSTQAGLCDMINYAAVVEDGVVIGKNGALLAGWRYSA